MICLGCEMDSYLEGKKVCVPGADAANAQDVSPCYHFYQNLQLSTVFSLATGADGWVGWELPAH